MASGLQHLSPNEGREALVYLKQDGQPERKQVGAGTVVRRQRDAGVWECALEPPTAAATQERWLEVAPCLFDALDDAVKLGTVAVGASGLLIHRLAAPHPRQALPAFELGATVVDGDADALRLPSRVRNGSSEPLEGCQARCWFEMDGYNVQQWVAGAWPATAVLNLADRYKDRHQHGVPRSEPRAWGLAPGHSFCSALKPFARCYLRRALLAFDAEAVAPRDAAERDQRMHYPMAKVGRVT